MHRLAHGPLPHRKVTPDCSLSTEVYKNGLVDSITRIAGDCRANSLSGVFPLRLCASWRAFAFIPSSSNAKQRSPGSNKTYLDTRPGPIVARSSHLPDPPNQLPARPADSASGAGFSQGGWPARANDPRPYGSPGNDTQGEIVASHAHGPHPACSQTAHARTSSPL